MSGRGYLLSVAIVMLLFYELPAFLIYGPSSSMPKGWYARVPMQQPFQRGEVVVLTPPTVLKAAIPQGLPQERLLKNVGGVPGDTVCWTTEAMTIHGETSATRYPLALEHPPVMQPQGCREVLPGELVLVAPHPHSLDSRYVGPIDARLVQFQVVPLWTWQGDQ